MAAALQSVGLKARVATDGPSAVEAFRAGDVSVCIVDMVMPGMNGPDVIEQIRAIDPSVIVIAMSGYDAEELFQKATRHAETRVRKPIDPTDLLQLIATVRVRASSRSEH
jgi:CheY-like chemotaxis protein